MYIMSLSTFLLIVIATLVIARGIVELSNIIEDKQEARRDVGRHPAGANKTIHRYYNRNREGA